MQHSPQQLHKLARNAFKMVPQEKPRVLPTERVLKTVVFPLSIDNNLMRYYDTNLIVTHCIESFFTLPTLEENLDNLISSNYLDIYMGSTGCICEETGSTCVYCANRLKWEQNMYNTAVSALTALIPIYNSILSDVKIPRRELLQGTVVPVVTYIGNNTFKLDFTEVTHR